MTNPTIQHSPSSFAILRRVITSTYIALSGAYGISVTGLIILRLLVSERWMFLAFLSTFLHLLMLPALILFPLSLLLRRPRLALTQAAPIALFLASYGASFLPREHTPKPGSIPLTLMTYNIHNESKFVSSITDVIRAANADVVAIQELSHEAASTFERELADLYPYRALHPRDNGTQGQGVLSRYPITADHYWRMPEHEYSLGHQRVELDIDGQGITLYNTHPLHPGMMTGRLFDNTARRAEIDAVLAMAAQDTNPVLIAGDFNMPDQTADYLHIRSQYGDTYREVGWGMGFTFPNFSHPQALPPYVPTTLPTPLLLRLDYIFHSAHFQAIEARVWPDSGGSDHHPVLARLALGISA